MNVLHPFVCTTKEVQTFVCTFAYLSCYGFEMILAIYTNQKRSSKEEGDGGRKAFGPARAK